MKAAMLTAPRQICIKDVSLPSYNSTEILIKVMATGLCGSDIHAYRNLHPFRKPPVVLGHEVAGEVVAVGAHVHTVTVGDRVVVEPQQGCGNCPQCNDGLYHLCSKKAVPGVSAWSGSFAEYFVAPQDRAYKIPQGVSWELAALTEPLAVGFHATSRSRVTAKDAVVVLGAGTIGLCSVLALRSFGVERLVNTDISKSKLNVAERFGAKPVLASNNTSCEIVKVLGGYADVVIVCTEYPTILEDIIAISGPRTRVVFLSLFESQLEFNLIPLVLRELEWTGSVTYNKSDFVSALRLVETKQDAVGALISKRMSIWDAGPVFEMVDKGDSSLIKVMFVTG